MPAKMTDQLKKTREARLGTPREDRQSYVTSLDDLKVSDERPTATKAPQVESGHTTPGIQRLQAAKEFGAKSSEELKDSCVGLIAKFESIGTEVTEAYHFKGIERFWALFGKSGVDKAQRVRLVRLQKMDAQKTVNQLQAFADQTIKELGIVEGMHVKQVAAYNEALRVQHEKLKEEQPQYKEARERRQALEVDRDSLKLELESGTLSEDERPQKQHDLEELEKQVHNALAEETDHLTVITNALRAIPVNQKNRDAHQQEIISIHQMRRDLLEKMQNFEELFKGAMISVLTQAKLERYDAVDPAMNLTISRLTEVNIKTAAAAMTIAIERVSKAAVSPEESLRFAEEMRERIAEWMKGIEALEEAVARGSGIPDDSSDSPEKPE